MAKPGKPRGLKIKHRGTRVVVTWQPNPRGFRHALRFSLSDGTQQVQVVGAKRRSFTLRGVPRSVRATVTVTGLTKANGKGPSARAAEKRGRR